MSTKPGASHWLRAQLQIEDREAFEPEKLLADEGVKVEEYDLDSAEMINEAQRDISYYLMTRYNWLRPHQFNDGLAPAKAEEKLYPLSGIS